MSAAELGALRLDGADVVLSACDTARRSGDASEVDTVGLVTAILAAGARTVTSSLWPVDDVATAQLMPAFHANRSRGFPPDQALAAAQQQVRVTRPHPFAWAAFTCQVIAATDLAGADLEVA